MNWDKIREIQDVLNQANQPERQRTLMDFARDENKWPSFKHMNQVPLLNEYIGKPEDKKKEYLESILSNSRITTNVLMYGALLILYKKSCKGALHQNVLFLSDLIIAVRYLFWYTYFPTQC